MRSPGRLLGAIFSASRAYDSARQADSQYDREYGVDTAGVIDASDLGPSGHGYQAMHPTPFRDVMNQLPIDFAKSLFVDLGCGKGRQLLLASEFPFRRVVGVEYARGLQVVAENNLRIYRGAARECRNCEVLCMDAAEYLIPSEPMVICMYNPFGAGVMREVVANVRRSLQAAPRVVFVVYFNPVVSFLWDEVEDLERYPIRQPEWPACLLKERVAVWTNRELERMNASGERSRPYQGLSAGCS